MLRTIFLGMPITNEDEDLLTWPFPFTTHFVDLDGTSWFVSKHVYGIPYVRSIFSENSKSLKQVVKEKGVLVLKYLAPVGTRSVYNKSGTYWVDPTFISIEVIN